MTSENITKERWDQLGLPPMELAESSENSRTNNGFYKCLFPTLQKLIVMILLTVLGVGTYVLLLKISEKYDSSRSTEIIIITGNSETPNVTVHNTEIFLQQHNTSLELGTKRKKRHTSSPADTMAGTEEPVYLTDEQLQQAREIILKHDAVCKNEEKQEICKGFVTKLKAIVEPKHDKSRINLKVNDDDMNKTTHNDVAPTEVSKRETIPLTNLDRIIESIPNMHLETRDAHPHSTSPHHLSDTCLLARLLKRNYPNAKAIYDPHPEYLEPHYEHPLESQSRYFSPAEHAPYLEAREDNFHRRKMHPQDVDIFMSFLKSKSEGPATERPSNITRETACPSGTIPCLSGDTCIEEKQWCDGNVDCVDVSDEATCTCKARVDKSRLCDGYFDCPFGEDEMGCFGCRDNMFSCEDLDINSHSTCFSKEQRCNNVVDCPNQKDEIECNMLAPSLLKKPLFAISNTEGFLHRNFKGDWYAVCKNPYMWAHDACRRETGLIIRPPFIQIVPIDPMLKIDYLNTGPGGLIQTSDTCMNSSAVYVTCPDLPCGTRVQSTSQLLRENTAIENHLFGRNKRFLLQKHPYPMMFYDNRMKRNVDGISKNDEIIFNKLKRDFFDTMRNKRESRVVGGKPSQPAAWPWMVAIYRNGMFHCGGVVITHSWVVSAAHCVHKFWDHYYEVQVGMLRRFSFSPQEQSHKVTHVIVNQHYSQTDMKNDLSLLKVEPAIQFSRWVRPICLPSPNTAGPDWLWGPSPGTICTAVGWGATTEHGPDPDHMREVEVPVWEKCKHSEDRAGKEICAGLTEGGKDACQGDSGGPLLCRNPLNSQQWYMAGIVSHGDGCARKDEPGVYTRVSLFVKWIKYHISSTSLPIVQPIQECPGFKCKTGISKCIPNKRKCDKIVDCLDGEDETKCEFTRTVPTLADSIFSPNHIKSPLEELLGIKEAQTESTLTSSNDKNGDVKTTMTTVDYHTSTSAPEQDQISSSVPAEDRKKDIFDSNSQIKDNVTHTTQSTKSDDVAKPDFANASTLEIINSSSEETFGISENNVTSDLLTTSTESSPQNRSDAEIITMSISGESLESRSSILERVSQTTTEATRGDIDSNEIIITQTTHEDIKKSMEMTTQRDIKNSMEITTRQGDIKNSMEITTSQGDIKNSMEITTRQGDIKNSMDITTSQGDIKNSMDITTRQGDIKNSMEITTTQRDINNNMEITTFKGDINNSMEVTTTQGDINDSMEKTTKTAEDDINMILSKEITQTLIGDTDKNSAEITTQNIEKDIHENLSETTTEFIKGNIENNLPEITTQTTPKGVTNNDEIMETPTETSTPVFTHTDFLEPSEKLETTTSFDSEKDKDETKLKLDAHPDPNSEIPDQETAESIHKNTDNVTSSNKDTAVKKIPNFEDKTDTSDKIEEIVFSEFEPAKLRRKHRIPREFDCRRIDQTIPYYQRCDRKADCEDGTDELDCTCTDYISTFDEKLVCDGVIDCADGQDESDCFSCPENHYLCKRSQICLAEKLVCDGKPHCPQGEDELDCFALTNGKEMEYDLDERPTINLEGYLTKKHDNAWHVVCDDKLSLEQQEQAATHICRYLGFSSANRYLVKYINLKGDEIAERSLNNKRNRRDTMERVPIHFAYRQESEENVTARHIVIKEPQVIKEQCVPNITKTCKSLYVHCDHSLFNDFDDSENIFIREPEIVSNHMWPWIAKVFVEGDYRCTGVLVNLSWVLVSDSCLWDSTLTHHYITVVLGSHRTLGSVNGMHEQVYQVDAKKDVYRSKASLLHLKEPAHYSNVVKPMVVSSSYSLEQKSTCVAVGQDNKNNTISVFLEETNENCHPSNRCFKRKAKESICPLDVTSHRHWAGIVSCHTDQGWYPAATFVDGRGECGLGDHINGTDIENLKNEIKHHYGKKTLPSLIDNEYGDDCEGVRCGRGRCLQLLQMCDGVRDCEDGGDESESSCDRKHKTCENDPYHKGCECTVGQLKCRNGKCVSKELFKDGNNDCGDGTDEPGQTTCSDYLARVMPSRLCDGILHCHDRSDEDSMFCKCFAKRTYKCGTKSGVDHCVAPDMVCDGVRDCPNGEDEQTCIGLNAPQGTPYGTGQVIVRSHGVWHSKCYGSQNHTKSELEAICSELGFISGHAKQIKEIKNFVVHPFNNLLIDPFNEIILNNNTVIKMRNTHEPIAKAVFDEELQNCFPVFIECR